MDDPGDDVVEFLVVLPMPATLIVLRSLRLLQVLRLAGEIASVAALADAATEPAAEGAVARACAVPAPAAAGALAAAAVAPAAVLPVGNQKGLVPLQQVKTPLPSPP